MTKTRWRRVQPDLARCLIPDKNRDTEKTEGPAICRPSVFRVRRTGPSNYVRPALYALAI